MEGRGPETKEGNSQPSSPQCFCAQKLRAEKGRPVEHLEKPSSLLCTGTGRGGAVLSSGSWASGVPQFLNGFEGDGMCALSWHLAEEVWFYVPNPYFSLR